MRVKEIFDKYNYSEFLKPLPFRKILPCNSNKFAEFLNSAIAEGETIYGDWDLDCDGICALKTIQIALDAIGYDKYVIAQPSVKRHVLSEPYARQIASQYKYILIVDSSSNSPEILDIFEEYNTKVLIIDHHEINSIKVNNYNKSFIINPYIDKALNNNKLLTNLSAGMLCSLLADWYTKTYYPDKYVNLRNHHFIYGVISLYSDSMPVSIYTASLIRNISTTLDMPPLVKAFQTQYDGFDKNFISWKFAPIINSLARFDRYDILYQMFFLNAVDESTINYARNMQKKAIQVRELLYSSLKIIICNNMVIGEIDAAKVQYFRSRGINPRNFTGLVAQMLSENYRLVGVCLIEVDRMEYEGSVRDTFNRKLLPVFKRFLQADGHASAFGIVCLSTTLPIMENMLDKAIGDIPILSNKILIDCTNSDVKALDFVSDITQIAKFNEFTGNNLPEVIIKLTLTSDCNIQVFPNSRIVANIGQFRIIDWNVQAPMLHKGATLKLKPYLRNSNVEFAIVKEK